MPWKEFTPMSQRLELVELACSQQANIALLALRFGVSRKTAYKWIARYRSGGAAALSDRSRRPHRSPRRSDASIEQRVIELRGRHPAWGGRKLASRLRTLGDGPVPAASTITRILRDAQLLDPQLCQQNHPWQRFEHPRANDLWQMDFKGHVPLVNGSRLHPLTVLDDHSRYALVLAACDGESGPIVKSHLTDAFRRYGLPRRMLADNGAPWGNCGQGQNIAPWSKLSVWLVRLGIAISHGRPWHPQTQGKEERFHRTLVAEVLRWKTFVDLDDAQLHLDPWRQIYNHERPHEALEMHVPAQRYAPSPRSFPESLPPVQYETDDIVRKVGTNGRIKWRGQLVPIGKAFADESVALRPTREDGLHDVYYCACRIGQIDQSQTSIAIQPVRALTSLASTENRT